MTLLGGSATLFDTSHRPWPLPERRFAIHMRWHDLAFLHWPIEAALLRPLIPPSLAVDTFDGEAWIGVVPFRMSGVRPRLLPGLPGHSAFPEINLRTYVRHANKPGVWFFSLDVPKWLAVRVARRTFHLPYFRARMQVEGSAGEIRYASERMQGPPAVFEARYGPTGEATHASAGSLDSWLTERYCLYSADRRGAVWRGDIHHARWPLEIAECELERNEMTAQVGLKLPETAPIVHFARRLDVVAWTLEPVAEAGRD